MMPPGSAELRQLAERVLTSTHGSQKDPALVAAAARRAYLDLVHVLTPIIGQTGTNALTARAVHLAGREHPYLNAARSPEPTDDVFERVAVLLRQHDPAVAVATGAAVLAALAGLLVTFIGESLTMRLLRQAWPDGFSDAGRKEGRA